MALPALDSAVIVKMNLAERQAYFMAFARRISDAPKLQYAIRIGSKMLYDSDTYALRMKFEEYARQLRRKRKRKEL